MNDIFDFGDDDVNNEVDIQPTKQVKGKTLFDHLKAITEREYDKDYFKKLNSSDEKSFSIYMLARYLSMNPNWISIINYFQKYHQVITPELFYKYYANLIPKQRIFLKYIKGEADAEYNPELIEMISKHFKVSSKDAKDYADILFKESNGIEVLTELCIMYGKTEKEIKKLLKVK